MSIKGIGKGVPFLSKPVGKKVRAWTMGRGHVVFKEPNYRINKGVWKMKGERNSLKNKLITKNVGT